MSSVDPQCAGHACTLRALWQNVLAKLSACGCEMCCQRWAFTSGVFYSLSQRKRGFWWNTASLPRCNHVCAVTRALQMTSYSQVMWWPGLVCNAGATTAWKRHQAVWQPPGKKTPHQQSGIACLDFFKLII